MRPIEDGALFGMMLVRHREILRERYGDAAVKEALGYLPEDVAAIIRGASADVWVPVEAVESLFEAMALRLHKDPATLHEEVGTITAERTLKSVWRILLRLTSDAHLVSQVPIAYRKTWNRGDLSARIEKPGHAVLALSAWPDTPEFPIRGVRIAVAETLRLSGRTGITVRSERASAGARYFADWAV